MKKIYSLSFFGLLLTSLIFAQAPIPNGGFETWTTGEPDGWGTSDGVLVGFGLPDPTTAEQDTVPANVYEGNSSVRLTNKNVSTPFGAQDIPGVVSLGTIGFDISTFSPLISGYAYTDRPDSVRFAAKFTSGPGGTDTGGVAVTLTRWTPLFGRQVIGEVQIPVVDNSSFTVFTQKIIYQSGQAPDTLLIQGIATTIDTAVLESQLWLDAISFIGLDSVNTGIEVSEEGLNVNIYPNPAAALVIVETSHKLVGGSIEVFDAVGKLVMKKTISATKSDLNVSGFASGLYSVRLINTAEKTVAKAKISIMH